jgi:hypothetical protein
MISVEVVVIQRRALVEDESRLTLEKWCVGLVTKLLKTTHGQWLYRNVHVHNAVVAGALGSSDQEEGRTEEAVGRSDRNESGVGLEEEDTYLLEINLGDLKTSMGEDLMYWLLALRAGRAAYLLRRGQTVNLSFLLQMQECEGFK